MSDKCILGLSQLALERLRGSEDIEKPLNKIKVFKKVHKDVLIDHEGCRDTVSNFSEDYFVECYVQTISRVLPSDHLHWPDTVVISGDGRYCSREIIERIARVCVGHKNKLIVIPKGGFVPISYVSKYIRQKYLNGGFYVTAGDLPGGPDGHQGIIYLNRHGTRPNTPKTWHMGLSARLTNAITTTLGEDVIKDIDTVHSYHVLETEFQIVDMTTTYLETFWREPSPSWWNIDDLRQKFIDDQCIYDGRRLEFKIRCPNLMMFQHLSLLLVDMIGLSPESIICDHTTEEISGSCVSTGSGIENMKKLCSDHKRPECVIFAANVDSYGSRVAFFTENGDLIPHHDAVNLLLANCREIFPSLGNINLVSTYPFKSAAAKPEGIDIEFRHRPTYWGNLTGRLDGVMRIGPYPTIVCDDDYRMAFAHPTESDAIYAVLAFLNIILTTRKPLSILLRELYLNYGRTYHCHYVFKSCNLDKVREMLVRIQTIADKFVEVRERGKNTLAKPTIVKNEDSGSLHTIVKMMNYVYIYKENEHGGGGPWADNDGPSRQKHAREPVGFCVDLPTTNFIVWQTVVNRDVTDLFVYVSKRETSIEECYQDPVDYLKPTLLLGQAICEWDLYLPDNVEFTYTYT